jgi:hypothetical protein
MGFLRKLQKYAEDNPKKAATVVAGVGAIVGAYSAASGEALIYLVSLFLP